MAQILVRKLDDAVLARLKARAKSKNRSAEAELREIITDALKSKTTRRPSLASLAGSARSDRSQADVDKFIRELRDEWDR